MAVLTTTLFARSYSQPPPPVVGERVGNLLAPVWHQGGSRESVGSCTVRFGKKGLIDFNRENFWDLETDGNATNVMYLEPTSAILNGYGAGFDFNILTLGKTYTVGIGVVQNRDNKVYVGFANTNGIGYYVMAEQLTKNVPRYYIYKLIPADKNEIYTGECGSYDKYFFKQTSFDAIRTSSIPKIRLLMGWTAAEGAERWDKTIVGYFSPFCYESETWFPTTNFPWRAGYLWGCQVNYETTTNNKIVSVGPVMRRGFSAKGNDISNACIDTTYSSFNVNQTWTLPDNKKRRYRKWELGYNPSKKIDMSDYKQSGTAVDDIFKK